MRGHHYYGEQNIICPFYCGEDKNNIYCQGLTKNTEMVSIFDTPTEKRTYKMNFCQRYSYMDCPYSRILDELRYQEENEMGKSSEDKLKSATEHIKELVKERDAVKRENYALMHQIDWRDRELKKKQAAVSSTEMLTKYLVKKLAGEEELRIPVRELAKFMTENDIIVVQDTKTNEIVCNLVDKKTGKILDKNYNDYQDYCKELVEKHGKKKVFSSYVRIKECRNVREKKKILNEALQTVKTEAYGACPKELKGKVNYEFETFDKNKGSFIVAWFIIEK